MSTPTLLQLVCFLPGDDNTFIVRMECDEKISDLKAAIKAKNKNAFRHIDAKNISLYKLVIECDRLRETLPTIDVAKLKELPASHELSRHFSDPLAYKLMFLVIAAHWELPTTGECN